MVTPVSFNARFVIKGEKTEVKQARKLIERANLGKNPPVQTGHWRFIKDNQAEEAIFTEGDFVEFTEHDANSKLIDEALMAKFKEMGGNQCDVSMLSEDLQAKYRRYAEFKAQSNFGFNNPKALNAAEVLKALTTGTFDTVKGIFNK